MDVQTLRAEAFKALHQREGAFVMANPWEAMPFAELNDLFRR